MGVFQKELSKYSIIIEETLANTIPNTLFSYWSDIWKDSLHQFILHGWKRLRPILAMIMANELWYDSKNNPIPFTSLEVFHDFLLIHDDIIDQDEMRRWKPTLHMTMQENLWLENNNKKHFGHAQAIIWGDVVYALAQDIILKSHIHTEKKITLLQLLSTAMQNVARWRYKQFLSDYIKLEDISLDYIIQYNLIDVTSSYSILFPLQFWQAIATGNPNISNELRIFAHSLWIIFQTGDDILGLFGDQNITGKSNNGDLIQGKKTIPLYFTYHYAPKEEKDFLTNTIGQKNLSDKKIQKIKNLISEYGMSHTQNFLDKHINICKTMLKQLPYSGHRKNIFEDFLEYLITRKI